MTKKILGRVLIGVVLVANMASAMFAEPAVAGFTSRDGQQETSEPACNSVDFVFLIDHSNAMQQADPNDLRIKIVQWTIMLLGYDHMYFCPDASYRVGVISYGGAGSGDRDKASPVIPMVDIMPRLSHGQDAWRRDWQDLTEKLIEPIGSDTRSMLDAVRMAGELLDSTTGSAIGSRRQAILMLTGDWGSPCTIDECYPGEAQYLLGTIADALPEFGDNRIFEVFAFPDNKTIDFERYAGETWVDIFEDMGMEGSNYVKVDKPELEYGVDLAEHVAELFFSFNPREDRIEEIGCSVEVPSFVGKMGLLIYKAYPDDDTEIDDPDPDTPAIIAGAQVVGSMQVPDSPNGTSAASVEPWVIERPVPGDWRIRNCEAAMYVLYFSFYADQLAISAPEDGIVLPQFFDPTNDQQLYDRTNPYYIEFYLSDDNNAKIRQYDVTPIVLGSLACVDSQGASTYQSDNVKFKYDPEDHLYRSENPLPTRYVGSCVWNVSFRRNAESENLNLTGGYSVTEITPIMVQVVLPTEETITVHGDYLNNKLEVLPFKVRAQFVTAPGGDPVALHDLGLPDDRRAMLATLTHVETRQQQTVWLQPSLVDPFVLEGAIGDELDLEGEYLLEVAIASEQETQVNPLFRFYGESTAARVSLNREDSLLTTPAFYLVALGSLCFLALMMMTRFVWAFTSPVAGTLEFYRKGAPDGAPPIFALPLASWHRRNRIIKPKWLASKTRLLNYIKYMKIQKVGKFNIPAVQLTVKIDHPNIKRSEKVTLLQDEQGVEPGKTPDIVPSHDLPGGIFVKYKLE